MREQSDARSRVCLCIEGARGCRTGLTSSGEWPVGKMMEKISFLGTPDDRVTILHYMLNMMRCHLCV